MTWAAWESGDEDDVRRCGCRGPFDPERVLVEMHPHAGVHVLGDSDDDTPDSDADAGSGAACWVALCWGCALLGCLGVGLYWSLLAWALR